ncbi:MAG TPA: serine/threonine-protein kinase [Streptosporangiaceae bacterium]|nr:serine/threonine-protein kinase [Streptosporangiaceae bacterium]
MADYKELYRLDRTSRKGGFAEVFLGTRKTDGTRIALKRPRRVPQATERLRREIEVQSTLPHPNIMPIIEADPDKGWFVMPPADGNLEDLRGRVDEEELASLLMGAADALAVAHELGHVHRDLTPPNILALPNQQGGRRWVIADWGLVSRRYGIGSIPLTKAGTPLGTDGFAAPEVMADGRSATPAADVYSLGRIAEWYLTGKIPAVGARVLPDGGKVHWRSFVRACTEHEASRRADLATFRILLDEVFTLVPGPPSQRAHDMVTGILRSKPVALSELFRLAGDHADDAEAYLDELARLPPSTLRDWTRRDPEGAAETACQMCRHVTHEMSWKDRDAEYACTPLSFVQVILMDLAAQGALGLVEDVAQDFFPADLKWSRRSQRTRVREWLADLDGETATVIARVMTRNSAIAEYYSPLRARHPQLASLLARQSAVPPP